MRYFYLVLLGISCFTQLSAQSSFTGFIENKGQIRSTVAGKSTATVLASAQSGPLTVFFHQDFVSYQLSETDEAQSVTRIHRVDLRLVSAQSADLIFDGASEQMVFYYTENYPQGIEVRAFSGLRYNEVYPGVDWVWTFADGKLKHEFHVKSGASHNQIKLDILGANEQQINHTGQLELNTELGLIVENTPQSYVSGKLVESAFRLDNNRLSYVVDRQQNQELVIDPSVHWSTYYGGNNGEIATAIDHDQQNHLYITGSTSSSTLFATLPGFTTFGSGNNDAFLLKFSTSGQLLWAAYFGGSGNDVGYALSVSPNGDYIAFGGYTSGSTNLASGMHPNPAHQMTPGSDQHDGFVAVFSPQGQRLWSTYYGGNNIDYVYGMRWKNDSSLYVVGETFSDSSIATLGSHQSTLGGNADGFLVAFNQFGQRLWATYYGGSSRDYMGDVDFFSNGDIAMAGSTNSVNGISTTGTAQSNSGGSRDFMLIRLSPTGQRIWATYYGQTGTEELNHMRVDVRDQVYIYGTTSSLTGMSFNGFQLNYGGSGLDGFIGRFSPTGSLLWSSYFGGSAADNGRGMSLDEQGNAYFTGIFGSQNLPTTPNAIQPNFGGGAYDSPILKLDSSGNVMWLSYFGGSGNDMAHAAVFANDYLYITGSATNNYPLLEPYQGSLRGFSDVMLTAFDLCDGLVQLSRSTNGILCANDTLILTASSGFNSYVWNTGDTTQQIQVTSSGSYWVYATNYLTECVSTSDTANVSFALPLQIDTVFGNISPMVGDITTYAVGQLLGLNYMWSVQGGVIVSGVNTSVIQVAWTADGPGRVSIIVIDSIGCPDSAHLNIQVRTGVSVEEVAFNKLKVYPNPSSDNFNFSWEGEATYKLRLTDLQGQLILEEQVFRNGSTLELGELPQGVYIYQLTANNKQTKFGRIFRQ